MTEANNENGEVQQSEQEIAQPSPVVAMSSDIADQANSLALRADAMESVRRSGIELVSSETNVGARISRHVSAFKDKRLHGSVEYVKVENPHKPGEVYSENTTSTIDDPALGALSEYLLAQLSLGKAGRTAELDEFLRELRTK